MEFDLTTTYCVSDFDNHNILWYIYIGALFLASVDTAEFSSKSEYHKMQMVDWLIVAILASALVPAIMDSLLAVDTSSWPTVAALVWDNLPVFIIVGVLWLILRRTGLGGRGGMGR